MLTLQTREEVGKNTSECRRWYTKVDAYWKIVTFQRSKPTHIACWQRRDNWSLNTSVRLLKLVCTTDWSAGLYNLLHWYCITYWNWAWINCCYCWIVVPPSPHILLRPRLLRRRRTCQSSWVVIPGRTLAPQFLCLVLPLAYLRLELQFFCGTLFELSDS